MSSDPSLAAPERGEVPAKAGWARAAGGLQGAVALLPGLLAIATGLVLTVFDAGFKASAWYAAALFLLVLIAFLVTTEPDIGSLDRLPRFALIAFAVFVAWNYLSILWADIPGDAWDGANRALLYGLVLVAVLTRPWPRAGAATALALTGFGIAVVAAGVLVAGASGEAGDFFLRGRLHEPAGYANAAASLWLIGFFVLLHLAAARVLPWPGRALALAGTCLLFQTAILTQSRGAAIAFVATAILYLALSPQRWTALASLLVVAVSTALSFDVLVAVREASSLSELASDFADARFAIALSTAVSFALGALGALLGPRLTPPEDRLARLSRTGNRALAGATVPALLAVLVAIGNPISWAEERWDDFRSGYDAVEAGDTRFSGSLGSNRYDFYRVALGQFADHPLTGIGADNFAVPYLQERRSSEAPRHPHGLPFRLLSQYGLVGTLAFLAFLVAMLVAVSRAARASGAAERGLVVAGLCGFSAWFVQGLADWLWAFPALGVLAFGLLAVAARTEGRPWRAPRAAPARPALERIGGAPSSVRTPARVALVVVAMAASVSLALPGIAARYTDAAYRNDGDSPPEVALERLDRAADLDFLSADSLLAKGIIARRLGREDVAVAAFAEAARREPKYWFTRFELGMSRAVADQIEPAIDELRAAEALNPRQPVIDDVISDVQEGKPIDPPAVERELNQQLVSKLRPVDPQ